MSKKSTFRIGELSKLFNIGSDSIRYYEEVGLIKPLRNPENNYRIYSIEHVQQILLIRELLKLNFSTEQIKLFMTKKTIQKTKELFETELIQVNEEINSLKCIKNNLLGRLKEINTLLNTPLDEVIRLEYFPNRNCIMIINDNSPDDYVGYYVGKFMNRHNYEISTIGISDCYTLDLPGSNPDSDYYRTKNVFLYSQFLPDDNCNYQLPAGNYLVLYYKGSYKKTKLLLPELFKYADCNNLSVCGDPIEFCHIDSNETDKEEEYIIELELPVTQR